MGLKVRMSGKDGREENVKGEDSENEKRSNSRRYYVFLRLNATTRVQNVT